MHLGLHCSLSHSQLLCDLLRSGTPLARAADGFENSKADQRDARLERDRRKRELLRFGDGLKRCEIRGPVV